MSELSITNIAFSVSFWILILADLIGNTLVILIILTNKTMKSPMNYLLINLAVADIMVGIFLAPVSVIQYFVSMPAVGSKGQIFCKVVSIENMTWIGGAASVFSLTAICFERYFAVMHPYSARLRMNAKKVTRIIITSWLFASALNAPVWALMKNRHQNGTCIEEWPTQPSWLPNAFNLLWLTAAGIVPLAIMVVMYSRVIYSLWFKQHQVQGTQLAMLKSRKRVTKMVLIVSFTFFSTWIPTLLLYMFFNYSIFAIPERVITATGTLMILFNSTFNPFIYGFQSANFRRHFKGILCCTKSYNNQLVLPPNSVRHHYGTET